MTLVKLSVAFACAYAVTKLTRSSLRIVYQHPMASYSGINSCMSFIKDFYASHVQCFISGWCAGHMYYTQSKDKHSSMWRPWPGQKYKNAHLDVKKYRHQGFTFHRAKRGGPVTRSLRDSQSFLLDYGALYRSFIRPSHHALLDAWLAERRDNIDGITWTEFDGRIFSVHDTFESCYRQSRMTFASHSVDLPLNRLRRLSNLVALNLTEPDALRAESFRSSIGPPAVGQKWQLGALARTGKVFNNLRDATPWSWALTLPNSFPPSLKMSFAEKSTALQNVMKNLDIGDACVLRKAFTYSSILKQCYESRADPVGYLSRTFRYPLTLLSAMFDSGCVITGPRALGFFLPSSTSEDSVWTFFVPGYKESVLDMVNVLEICGVSWQLDAAEVARSLLPLGTASISSADLECLNSRAESLDPAVAQNLLGTELYGRLKTYKEMNCGNRQNLGDKPPKA
ncbi:hypothetical protein MAC_03292 [Metarhizium acridum CQMa 102]|uniref:Uncharacterized protein n=1 Tax=Metarhizium acridum (strain CQMa 102) TaxID=655827 RepID=E9E0B1_METAQ|nr:uncharacterized protein MAC_03292 [Metarhizium acridum CQMa 102]EFY90712.1 hypothetical protein MAC_03292 [Metarhizium acridum CQMa 102]